MNKNLINMYIQQILVILISFFFFKKKDNLYISINLIWYYGIFSPLPHPLNEEIVFFLLPETQYTIGVPLSIQVYKKVIRS